VQALLKFLHGKRDASIAEIEAVFNDVKESRCEAEVVFELAVAPLPPVLTRCRSPATPVRV
jgi:hypothetical protein